MSWPAVPFEQLYDIPSKNGLTRPSRVRGSGIKMINMGELFANDRIGNIPMELVPVNEQELDSMQVQSGDLLFARQSLVLAGAGKCSLVKECSEPTTFESHIIRVRLNREFADPEFFYYYFRSPNSGMRSIVTQGVQAGIRASDLKLLPVKTPDVPTQRRIATILSAYDDLIENNRRRIQLLEQSARLLYNEWFVHLRFPGHERVKIKDGVPEGWERRKLGEICGEIRESVEPASIEADTPYIGLEHMPRRAIALNDWGKASDVTSSKLKFSTSDILFGKIRPYFHKVGFPLVDGVGSSDIIVLRPNDISQYSLVLSVVSSDAFVAVTAKTMKEGSKMPRADWKVMREYPVLLPNDPIMRAYEAQISPLLGQLKTLSFANRKLAAGRDVLLPKLMSGEVLV